MSAEVLASVIVQVNVPTKLEKANAEWDIPKVSMSVSTGKPDGVLHFNVKKNGTLLSYEGPREDDNPGRNKVAHQRRIKSDMMVAGSGTFDIDISIKKRAGETVKVVIASAERRQNYISL